MFGKTSWKKRTLRRNTSRSGWARIYTIRENTENTRSTERGKCGKKIFRNNNRMNINNSKKERKAKNNLGQWSERQLVKGLWSKEIYGNISQRKRRSIPKILFSSHSFKHFLRQTVLNISRSNYRNKYIFLDFKDKGRKLKN